MLSICLVPVGHLNIFFGNMSDLVPDHPAPQDVLCCCPAFSSQIPWMGRNRGRVICFPAEVRQKNELVGPLDWRLRSGGTAKQPYSLARRDPQQSHWLGCLLPHSGSGNMVHRGPQAVPASLAPCVYLIPDGGALPLPQVISLRQDPNRPPWKHVPQCGKAGCPFGVLLLPARETRLEVGMGGSSGSAMPAWGRNNVVRLQLLLLPLNVVLLSLCGPDGCFSLTPTSYDFLCGKMLAPSL